MPKLQEIAELAGRFRREARKIQANKKRPGPDEVTDIETGDAIQRALPAELLLLGDPILKMDFLRRYSEKSILQYKLEEPDRKAKGPIVVCVDNSGSMKGRPEIWSKAIALALCRIAMDSKRDFAIVHFAKDVRRVDQFIYPAVNPDILMDSCAYFSSGSTNFDPALEKAFQLITKGANGAYKKADIIFLTDGIGSPVNPEILKLKKTTGAVLYGICIGVDSAVLRGISDSYITIQDLAEDSEAKETIFNV